MSNLSETVLLDDRGCAAIGIPYFEAFRHINPSEFWIQPIIEDLDADAFDYEMGEPDDTPLDKIFN